MANIKKCRPLLNHVITTADKYESFQLKNGIVDTSKGEGEIKEFQRIVALGPNCYESLNVGDVVMINPRDYMVPVHSMREGSVFEKDKDEVSYEVRFPVVDIDGQECLFLYDRDLDLIVDEFGPEDEEE